LANFVLFLSNNDVVCGCVDGGGSVLLFYIIFL